ncbi:MAG TPA: metalloregulator ArsR/SmtB family transcription factor [Dehalococcoidia bacterium]|nr:metalloregulator ArsR/SmtB family transcription factor [Dehalococcoidia bacterium]
MSATPAVDRTLSALADTHRRRVVELLGDGPMRAGDLAAAVGLAAPAMSRHLRILRAGGLIAESHPESDARVRLYRLIPEPLLELEAWLTEMQVLWSDQLASFKAHVEGG